ncbi:flagellar transcriptional regulator FlhD [[Enterobacter] lignolyticus]|uniref:Flagellar transcriptional regulator FlhD n=1 Tax=[Enterobacter] lignolyticus TaxID=1334193 RepID=A0A806XDR0_9ENTR|nr:flagellar transcriptional regulator FlhD [[Enterobacter] lignolyticus]ALR77177.1 hypothetical protein AO703_12995 [[Enterobacter] lignolyticus]
MTDFLTYIHEMNVSYLHLAQNMLNADQQAAMFRLGIDKNMAETLMALTPVQIMKLAELNQLIMRLRFSDHESVARLVQDSRVDALQHIHTGILLTTDLLNKKDMEDCSSGYGDIICQAKA